MQGNEFEKQVQSKLEELQLSPTASVWIKVEAQIKKRKRRRIIFFFILPAALALIGFSIYQFALTGEKAGQVESIALKEKNIPAVNPGPMAAETKTLPLPVQEVNGTTVNNKSGSVKIVRKPLPEFENGNITDTPVASTEFKTLKKANPINNDRIIKIKKNNDPIVMPNTSSDQEVTKESTAALSNTASETKISFMPDSIHAGKAPILADANIFPVKDSMESVTKPYAKKETIVKINQRNFGIQWGIEFSVGMTANHTGVFSLEKNFRGDLNAGPATGGAPVITPPSAISPGPAFSGGLIGEWRVSNRSRFSSGMKYTFASNRIKTGTRTDTTIQLQNNYTSAQVDQVYRGAQQNRYNNKYHFITIPAWYHWQINKAGKTSVQWNVGIDASYLITTGALLYDAGYGGIYYNDKNAFKTLHFALGTGISFRLGEKNKLQWVVGPELSFDMNRLVKNSSKQYLLYGGVDVKLFFPKKKK